MRRVHDTATLDLFQVPTPAPETPGTMDYRVTVAHLVSEMLRGAQGDRFDVAAKMSRLTGKDVSKNMLDAYASDAREDHNLPFYLVAAMESVCESYALTGWLVDMRGGRLLVGREALNAELGKLERARDEASKQIKKLKTLMGEQE